MAWISKEVGSIENQCSQRAVKNGWMASAIFIATILTVGGWYHPNWDDGGMLWGALFAGFALGTPFVMAVVGVMSYRRHWRRLNSLASSGQQKICRIWKDGKVIEMDIKNGGCEYCA